MRACAGIVALAAVAGCSSGGGTRPNPPPTQPISVVWTEVQQDTAGAPLADITSYEITYGRAGTEPTRISVPADRRTLTLQLPSGRWSFAITATSAALGTGEAGQAMKVVP